MSLKLNLLLYYIDFKNRRPGPLYDTTAKDAYEMSDPLSVAGSIAGLISVADTVFRLVFKYARSAINAKEEIKSLASEIQTLAGILCSLRVLAGGLEAEGQTFDPTLRTYHLGTLSSILSSLEQRIEKAESAIQSDSKTLRKLQQLKWPFSTTETKELLQDLIRHKSSIALALTADSMRKLQMCLARQDAMSGELASIADAIGRLGIHSEIVMNDYDRKVLNFFATVNPQQNFETSVRLRHPMTGLWLTGSPTFTNWLRTPGSRLWLSGIPGAGKTVLAGAVIQETLAVSHANRSLGTAFFFCDYKNPGTWAIVNVLGAILSQLAQQKKSAYEKVQQFYHDLHPDKHIPKKPSSDELSAKITEISADFQQTFLVVDGLDECGDYVDEVAEILCTIATHTPNMCMTILSRHEINIRDHLQDHFDHISIAAHSDDVRIYVGSELETRIQNRRLRISSPGLRDEILKRLTEKANGMFRWVACQLDYLCECYSDADRRKALEELPPDLPETYRRIIERVNKAPARVISMVQMCLHFIAFMPGLSILELRNAISAPDLVGDVLEESSIISEDEIARRCSSLIRKSKDGRHFEFAHFTVREFLIDESLLDALALEKFHLKEERGKKIMAIQSLRFLLSGTFARRPETDSLKPWAMDERRTNYPFYHQAARKWIKNARNHFDDPTLWELVMILFDSTKRANLQEWVAEYLWIHYCKRDYDGGRDSQTGEYSTPTYLTKDLLDPNLSPLHLAAMFALPKVCKSLIENGASLESQCAWGTPLQVAVSSLFPIFPRSHPGNFFDDEKWHLDLWCGHDSDETVDILLKAGAKVNCCHNDASLLDLAFDMASSTENLGVAKSLLLAGVMPRIMTPKHFYDCLMVWDEKFTLHFTDPEYQIYPSAGLHSFLSLLNDYLEKHAPHKWHEYPAGHTIHLFYKIARIGYLFLSKHYQTDMEEFESFGSRHYSSLDE